MHIWVGNILTLAPTTQYYAIAQTNFDTFAEQFLELEAVLAFQNSTKQLLSSRSYLLIRFLNSFGSMKTTQKP